MRSIIINATLLISLLSVSTAMMAPEPLTPGIPRGGGSTPQRGGRPHLQRLDAFRMPKRSNPSSSPLTNIKENPSRLLSGWIPRVTLAGLAILKFPWRLLIRASTLVTGLGAVMFLSRNWLGDNVPCETVRIIERDWRGRPILVEKQWCGGRVSHRTRPLHGQEP